MNILVKTEHYQNRYSSCLDLVTVCVRPGSALHTPRIVRAHVSIFFFRGYSFGISVTLFLNLCLHFFRDYILKSYIKTTYPDPNFSFLN